jgi:UV DNA damage repair endonuclease
VGHYESQCPGRGQADRACGYTTARTAYGAFRISEMLQGYTEPSWIDWWQQRAIQDHLEKIFAPIGETARRLDVRLSFHPGQFCVLASENPGIVERSIQEFEYHADMARWMGYGKSFQDFKINVHISGKRGPAGIIDTLGRLSPEARNCITIENDENCLGSRQQPRACPNTVPLYLIYTITGSVQESTFNPPTIEFYA